MRQALSYTFPYEAFVQGVLGDRGVQAVGPVPATMWGHWTACPSTNTTWIEQAEKELLTKAGYPDGSLSLTMTYATGNQDEQQVGELWKAELAKLGIDLELQPMNWEAQWDLGESDPAKAQDVFVMYWWPDLVSPYSFLYSLFRSKRRPYNLAYYSNKTFDETIDKANQLSGVDKQKASDMFVEAQEDPDRRSDLGFLL